MTVDAVTPTWYDAVMDATVQTSMRMSSDVPARADAILAKLKADPRLVGMRLTRSAVIRSAITRGLAQLEAECAVEPDAA